MADPKITDGECPRCSSREIYLTENGIGGAEFTFVRRISLGSKSTTMETYLCTRCGYFENYIANQKHLDQISKLALWVKVPRSDR